MAKSQKLPSTLKNMTVVLCLVAAFSALLIGGAEFLTKEPIQKAKDAKELQAISSVVGEFDNNPFAEQTIITNKDNSKLILYPTRKEGNINGIAIKSYSNKAFGGKLELIVGFSLDGTINDYEVIDQKETPGLGSKVMDPKFKDQFAGFNPSRQVFKVKQDGGAIDAVTAATISSRAVIDAIQRAYDAYNKFSTGN